MADEISNFDLMHSAQRALLFNITPDVRFIFIAKDTEASAIRMLVYLDCEPDEEKKDMFYAVAGEIGGDFPAMECFVKIKATTEKFEKLEKLKLLVYARYE